MKAFNWNVVICGNWNRAILTPEWIAKKLFGLQKGTPIEVLIPINVLAPTRVRYGGFVVVADDDFLEIKTEKQEFGGLVEAMKLGIRAMTELPVTPFSAAGYNIRYELDSPEEPVYDKILSEVDTWLSTNEYDIETQTITRSVKPKEGDFVEGIINFTGSIVGSKVVININFHRSSSEDKDLQKWLSITEDKIQEEVGKLLLGILEIKLENP